jgi:hypothetical protein
MKSRRGPRTRARARARLSGLSAACYRTSESRNKPLRGNGGGRPSFDGYRGYCDLRGFARHVGERPRFSPRRFSRAIETNVLKCTHTHRRAQAPCSDLARVLCTPAHAHRAAAAAAVAAAALAEMEDSVVRRYPGGISLIERLAFPLFSQQFLVPIRIIR